MGEKKKKILFFEDNYMPLSGLKTYLEEKDYEVEVSAAKKILLMLKGTRFDLIIIDSMIRLQSQNPQGETEENVYYDDVNWIYTGLEFLKRLRQGEYSLHSNKSTSPDVPVILLSAIDEKAIETHQDVCKLANAHIEKPFRLSEFKIALEKLIKE
jgi:CheY-like chemotaxis protein